MINGVGNMIRRATEKDISRLAEIHVMGWRTAYRDIVDDKILFGHMQVGKRLEVFRTAVKDKNESNFVYEEDGIVKGFLTMGKSRDEDGGGAYELWSLYVDPLMTGKGIGTELIRFCEKKAQELGYIKINLWILKDNEIGRLFYDNLGYIEDGKKRYIEKLKLTEIRYSKKFKADTSQVRLRRARMEDALFLYDVKTSMLKVYSQLVWGEWDELLQRKRFKEEFGHYEHYVITYKQVDIGILQVNQKEDTVEIIEVELVNAYQETGIEEYVISEIIADYKGIGKRKSIQIGCFKLNAKAKKLYEKLGFQVIKENETHYVLEQ